MPTSENDIAIVETYLIRFRDTINWFGFSSTDIVKLLRFCLTHTYNGYIGKYYRQLVDTRETHGTCFLAELHVHNRTV